MLLKENEKGKVRCPKTNRLRFSKNCFNCNSQGGMDYTDGIFYTLCDGTKGEDVVK
jgi:hypothetical protein